MCVAIYVVYTYNAFTKLTVLHLTIYSSYFILNGSVFSKENSPV